MFAELEMKEGWVSIGCTLLILLCVAWSFQAVHWTEGLSILQGVVLVGGGLGIVLAKSRAPNRMTHLLSILAGLTWSCYLISRVLAENLGLSAQEAALYLDRQIQDFVYILFTGGTDADTHIFLLLLALLLWAIAYFSTWAVFRWHRVWWAIIVSGIALMVNIGATSKNLTAYLIGFLLFSLLLVVRTSLAFYEQEWRRAEVSYSPELVYSFLRAGFMISALAIFLAWVAPDALASRPLQQVWDKVGEPWRKLQDESSRLFQDLDYQNDPPILYTDRWTRFGGPVELTDAPVANVRSTTGRYWRVIAFHEYSGDGWGNTDIDTILIGEYEQDIAFPELELRQEVTQTFTLQQDLAPAGTLVAAAQPLRASVPLRAVVSYITHEEDVVRSRSDETVPSFPGDASILYSRQPLQAGDTYQIVSSLSTADEESLRQASTTYPGWIRPRYLQLPDSLPERVRYLAQGITADQENAYDKAKAIESYLREIPYNDQIEGPTRGQDGVDYFLFDAQEGYCDYYASAMVVMLRAVGVPARYVRGFGQGSREEGEFRILERDSHAWTEAFFPGYGWIEFEPTGGEPPLNRRSSQEDNEGEGAFPRDRNPRVPNLEDLMEPEMEMDSFAGSGTTPGQPTWQRIGLWLGLALALLLAVGISTYVVISRRRHMLAELKAGERVYENLVNWVRRLFRINPLAHQTPLEYASSVGRAVPRGSQAIEQIAGFYVKERFGSKAVSGAEADVAWRQVRSALWQQWVQRRVDRVRRIWWRLVPPALTAEQEQ